MSRVYDGMTYIPTRSIGHTVQLNLEVLFTRRTLLFKYIRTCDIRANRDKRREFSADSAHSINPARVRVVYIE